MYRNQTPPAHWKSKAVVSPELPKPWHPHLDFPSPTTSCFNIWPKYWKIENIELVFQYFDEILKILKYWMFFNIFENIERLKEIVSILLKKYWKTSMFQYFFNNIETYSIFWSFNIFDRFQYFSIFQYFMELLKLQCFNIIEKRLKLSIFSIFSKYWK